MIIQPREMAQVMENFLFWPSRKLTHRGHKVITQKVCGGGKEVQEREGCAAGNGGLALRFPRVWIWQDESEPESPVLTDKEGSAPHLPWVSGNGLSQSLRPERDMTYSRSHGAQDSWF